MCKHYRGIVVRDNCVNFDRKRSQIPPKALNQGAGALLRWAPGGVPRLSPTRRPRAQWVAGDGHPHHDVDAPPPAGWPQEAQKRKQARVGPLGAAGLLAACCLVLCTLSVSPTWAQTLDNTAPTVTSIERQSPSSSRTNADSLTWRVTFSEDVANVDAADFTVTGTTATLSVTVGTTPAIYDVTASGGDLAGLRYDTVTLDFAVGQDIVDMASHELENTVPTGTNDHSYRVDNTGSGICGRTAVVRNAILAEISGVSNCAEVTDADLAAITGTLDLRGRSISALVAWDFAGLTALVGLRLDNNLLTTLPVGVFDELTALVSLRLFNNLLTTLPVGMFDDLTALTLLRLDNNLLATLPVGVFDKLTALTWLRLIGNKLTTLPAGVFDDLTALRTLQLSNNSLTTLPAGVFDELTALTRLDLNNNSLHTLPAGVFDRPTALTRLDLNNNSLRTLRAGVFDKLTALMALQLNANRLGWLPAGVFEKLTALTRLQLANNPMGTTAPTVVALPDDGTVSDAGGTVMLDGSGSGGAWGTNVTYSWALTRPASGVAVAFDDNTSATPVVTVRPLAVGTKLTFTLTVTGVAAPTKSYWTVSPPTPTPPRSRWWTTARPRWPRSCARTRRRLRPMPTA